MSISPLNISRFVSSIPTFAISASHFLDFLDCPCNKSCEVTDDIQTWFAQAEIYCFRLDGFYDFFCNNNIIFSGVILLGFMMLSLAGFSARVLTNPFYSVPCVIDSKGLIGTWIRKSELETLCFEVQADHFEVFSVELMGFGWPGALSNIRITWKAIPYWQVTSWLQGQSTDGTNPEKQFSLYWPSCCTTKDWHLVFIFSLKGLGVNRSIEKGIPNHKPNCIFTKQ